MEGLLSREGKEGEGKRPNDGADGRAGPGRAGAHMCGVGSQLDRCTLAQLAPPAFILFWRERKKGKENAGCLLQHCGAFRW